MSSIITINMNRPRLILNVRMREIIYSDWDPFNIITHISQMPIQTIVASLVVVYLRDEMDIIRARITKLQKYNEQLDGDMFLNTRKMWEISDRNRHLLFTATDYHDSEAGFKDNEEISIAMVNMTNNIVQLESQLQQIANSYNNLLIAIKQDSDPTYQPIETREQYKVHYDSLTGKYLPDVFNDSFIDLPHVLNYCI